MRSIWKGHIRFSLVTIPIRIYNAVDTEETIRFQQLHKEDNGAVGYEKKCKKCGKTLTAEEIVKGYQFEPEQYVIVSPEDLEKIKLKSTKVIEIEGFIDDQNAYNGDIAALDERNNLLDAREQRLADFSQRILAAVKAQFGPDSNEFELAGGVRRSDRKKPVRTTKAPATS